MDIQIEFKTEKNMDSYAKAIQLDYSLGSLTIAYRASNRFSMEFTDLTETQATLVRGLIGEHEGKEIFLGSSDVSIEFKGLGIRSIMARHIAQERPDIDKKVEKTSVGDQFIIARGLTDRQFDWLTEEAAPLCGNIRVMKQKRASLPLHAADNI